MCADSLYRSQDLQWLRDGFPGNPYMLLWYVCVRVCVCACVCVCVYGGYEVEGVMMGP